jgi:CheY-like chemotaxis protein
MKLLLVEDSERLQRSLSTGLKKLGFTLDQAFDGEQALAYIAVNPHDAIILDLMLTRIDGLTVLSKLRSNGKDCHVLILSANDQTEDRVRTITWSSRLRLRLWYPVQRFGFLPGSIVDNDLDEITLEGEGGLEIFTAVLKVDLENFLPLVGLFFDVGDLRTGISCQDDVPDLAFANGERRPENQNQSNEPPAKL